MTNSNVTSKWIPFGEVQSFFNYRPTQMAALLKDSNLKVAKVGKRKFILKDSLDSFLEKKSIR